MGPKSGTAFPFLCAALKRVSIEEKAEGGQVTDAMNGSYRLPENPMCVVVIGAVSSLRRHPALE